MKPEEMKPEKKDISSPLTKSSTDKQFNKKDMDAIRHPEEQNVGSNEFTDSWAKKAEDPYLKKEP